jgi:dTDP-4-amino-4,6-dideoxygalactose transaminase
VFNAPQPRSRLYTTAASYTGLISGGVFGTDDDSEVAKLESALAALLSVAHVIAVPQARVGIYLTLKHLVRPGQKVVLSPYTITDVVNMVVCAGAIPVFADVAGDGSCNIDPEAVADLLDCESNVGAVMVTHFYGLACDIEPLRQACAAAGVPLVEDAAQAFGARVAAGQAGTIGRAGIFSFGLLKNVTGFLGGAVATNDADLAREVRAELETFPITPREVLWKKAAKGGAFDLATFPPVFDAAVYWLFRYAYLHDMEFFANKLDTDADPSAYRTFPQRYAYRMSGAQAAIIRAQLDRSEAQTKERIAKATLYHEGLKDVPELTLPPRREDGSHIYFYYTVLARDRDALARSMTRQYRDVQISHHRNCANLPCFAEYGRPCPNAEAASREALYLPTYPGYRDDQIEANIAAIRRHAREHNR